MSRKRKRAESSESQNSPPQMTAEELAKKEQEIWEAVKEEHFEGALHCPPALLTVELITPVVEQMPLTLHRQYALMHELDEQTVGYMNDLQPTLRKYITSRLGDGPRSAHVANQTSSQSSTANQTMLSHIAWLSEELMRAAEEKVNLAQSAHDYVDRHIRLLDQAIKEQEAIISVGGVREGTRVALPELVLPRPLKFQTRDLLNSPIDDDTVIGIEAESPPSQQSNNRSKRNRRKSRKGPESGPLTTPRKEESGSGLKITLPPINSPKGRDGPWCTCRKPSYGAVGEVLLSSFSMLKLLQMVACDDKKCKIEWVRESSIVRSHCFINYLQFHLPCVQLDAVPTTRKWFCPNCRPAWTQR